MDLLDDEDRPGTLSRDRWALPIFGDRLLVLVVVGLAILLLAAGASGATPLGAFVSKLVSQQ